MNILAPSLWPMNEKCNPFKDVYGTIAKISQPLCNAVMLASVVHLTSTNLFPPVLAKSYRDLLQKSFQDALQSEEHDAGLAATLLLSTVVNVSKFASWLERNYG